MAWTIDPAHTTVGFSAKHMGLSTVRGQFTRFDATFDIDGDDLTTARGRVEVEIGSLDSGNQQRDGHLLSPDFLDAEQHPTMVFEPRSIRQRSDDVYDVTGDLTIRGVTREVTLQYEHAGSASDPWGNRRIGGSLSGTINRSDWGLRWNVPLGGGGLLVSEKVRIEVEGQLVESAAAATETAVEESAAV